ncbi:hypothetical protein CBL_05314 [Carabus blaptoides fortunei]
MEQASEKNDHCQCTSKTEDRTELVDFETVTTTAHANSTQMARTQCVWKAPPFGWGVLDLNSKARRGWQIFKQRQREAQCRRTHNRQIINEPHPAAMPAPSAMTKWSCLFFGRRKMMISPLAPSKLESERNPLRAAYSNGFDYTQRTEYLRPSLGFTSVWPLQIVRQVTFERELGVD